MDNTAKDDNKAPAEGPTRGYYWPLTTGITPTPGFAKKKLATHAVNPGLKCSHDCLYCSTGAMNRMHKAFQQLGVDPFAGGYAIIDPDTPERVARDARRMRQRGMVEVSTTVDAWAPEAKACDLGRRCIEAILAEPGWTVRVLTKNASVRDDFDFLEGYRDRVTFGMSLTASPERREIAEILEPNASPIRERMGALVEAAARGLRTYGMLCPLLPGVADAAEQVDKLVRFCGELGAEEIFVEPVNARGPGLRRCQEALELWGYSDEARAVGNIRHHAAWSRYAVELLGKVQPACRRHSDIDRLRFLLYPSRLRPEDAARIRADDAGVVWLTSDHGRHQRTNRTI